MLKQIKTFSIFSCMVILMGFAFTACAPGPQAYVKTSTPQIIPVYAGKQTAAPKPATATRTLTSIPPTKLPTAAPQITPTSTSLPGITASVDPTPLLDPTPTPKTVLSPESWKTWPVMPSAVSEALRQAYQAGVAQGKIDPHAFSVFGDCQGEADAFLGVFDTSPGLVKQITPNLQEYVNQFSGSFNRYNPAAKSGSSAGSVLFAPWNDNKDGLCLEGETPVDCELRVHRPSIVFIQLGTHFEPPERNYLYLSTIIEKVLETGAVPVMVTKADNLELTGYVNQNIADLASEYDLPTWNFWSSVQGLPEQGLQPNGMHLTEAGTVTHQLGALRVLGAIWSALQ
jgi:hypothetical protein